MSVVLSFCGGIIFPFPEGENTYIQIDLVEKIMEGTKFIINGKIFKGLNIGTGMFC
ncbi:hypothetical protein [Oribacterium sp. WCC10]|uniref:hypothetical protein n=1 Tax=Oribacterium sp. WCC10 TaxID=1855343 RepID=UPI001586FB34|nr:hypothetical protein [Oribacterium sp. WCC10]